MYFSPLEQFNIYKLISIHIGFFDISITNSTFFLFFVALFTFFFLSCVLGKSLLIPSVWQSIFELLYQFIYYNIVSENIKKNGNLYFPVLFSIFFFVLLMNIIGLVPFSFTITSHIVVTFGLAATIFIGINYIGIKTRGLHILSLFLPSGAPLIMAPLLVFIEVVSYSFRVVSLSLRLFANMMSGHCLLKILAGFSWAMFSSGTILSIFHVLPLIVIFLITGLEIGIAFLQAYVFTLLLCVYLNDAISLH